MLVEQTYGGVEDYTKHFYTMLPAFKDKRYMKVGEKLIFGIFDPANFDDFNTFAETWNSLARENGLAGFYFFAFAQGVANIKAVENNKSYDSIVYDPLYDAVYINLEKLSTKIIGNLKHLISKPNPMTYDSYCKIALKQFERFNNTIPCIDPNFDHSPRSGSNGVILHDSTPDRWGRLCSTVSEIVGKQHGKDGLLFIKSWNEWGEGNYLEPDLRFGTEYIEETAKALGK